MTATRSDDRNRKRPTEPSALVFDMDGVLLEGRGTDPEIYERAADEAASELGASPDESQRRALGSYACDGTLRAVCDDLGIDVEAFWRERERRASRLAHERMRAGGRTTYDDVAALRDLAAERTLALVSNNRQATVEFVVDHFDLGDHFAAVRGRDPTVDGFRRRKPDPHYLTETTAKLGVDAGLYVGDRSTDVLAAERAGLESVFLRRSFNRGESPEPTPDYEVESLYELEEIVRRVDANRNGGSRASKEARRTR